MDESKGKGFFGNTMRLIFGNVGAQVVNLITIPIITRLYSPGSFGLFTLFLALSTTAASISNLRMEFAILLPEEKDEATGVFYLSLLILAILSAVFFIAGLSCSLFDLNLNERYEELLNLLYLFVIYFFLLGLYKISNFWHIRNNHFKILSIAIFFQAIASKGFAIAMGYLFGDNPLWLIGGLLFGALTASFMLFFKDVFRELCRIVKTSSFSKLSGILHRYKAFPIYSPISLLEILSKEIVPVLFGVFFSTAVVGFFGLANRVLQRPLNTFSDAISRSFFYELSKAKRNSLAYGQKAQDLFNYLFLFGMTPIIIFSLIAPELVGIVFGSDWQVADKYIAVLAFPFFSLFLLKPLSFVFEIQERQGLRFVITVTRFALAALAVYLGAITASPLNAVYLYSSTIFAFNIILIFLLLKLAGASLSIVFKQTAKNLIIISISVLPLVWAKYQWDPDSSLILVILATLLIALYFWGIAAFDQKIKLILKKLWFSKKTLKNAG